MNCLGILSHIGPEVNVRCCCVSVNKHWHLVTVFHVRAHLWPLEGCWTRQVEGGVVELHCDNVLLTSALVEICKSLEVYIYNENVSDDHCFNSPVQL